MNNENIGKFLQELRLSKNLTQANVAQICNVTHQAVSQWENGKALPDIEGMKSLSELYSISINGILDCKRSDNELQPVTATGTKNEEGVPSKTLTVLLISFVMFVLSFILIIVGLFSRVLPLMILPAFIISMFQSLYIFITMRKSKINTTYININSVISFISFIFFIISSILFIVYLNHGLDAFGYIQPLIYAILTLTYFLYSKYLTEENNDIQPGKSLWNSVTNHKESIIYYVSLIFPTFLAIALLSDSSYNEGVINSIICILLTLYLITLLILLVIIALKKRFKLLALINLCISSVGMTIFVLYEWVFDYNSFININIESILMVILVAASISLQIYGYVKFIGHKKVSL